MTMNAVQASLQELSVTPYRWPLMPSYPSISFGALHYLTPLATSALLLLSPLAATAELLTTLPHFDSRYGSDNRRRLLLQMLYQYFRRIDDVETR